LHGENIQPGSLAEFPEFVRCIKPELTKSAHFSVDSIKRYPPDRQLPTVQHRAGWPQVEFHNSVRVVYCADFHIVGLFFCLFSQFRPLVFWGRE